MANGYKGAGQIRAALEYVHKFRATLENKLWPAEAKEVPWADIRRRAATDRLTELIPEGNLNLAAEESHFEAGRNLLDMVREPKDELKAGEVQQ